MTQDQLISTCFDMIILIVLVRFAWKKRNLLSDRGIGYKLVYFVGIGGATLFFVYDLIQTLMISYFG